MRPSLHAIASTEPSELEEPPSFSVCKEAESAEGGDKEGACKRSVGRRSDLTSCILPIVNLQGAAVLQSMRG